MKFLSVPTLISRIHPSTAQAPPNIWQGEIIVSLQLAPNWNVIFLILISSWGLVVNPVHCAVFSVNCAVCSVHGVFCSVKCAIWSVQCAVCSVRCVKSLVRKEVNMILLKCYGKTDSVFLLLFSRWEGGRGHPRVSKSVGPGTHVPAIFPLSISLRNIFRIALLFPQNQMVLESLVFTWSQLYRSLPSTMGHIRKSCYAYLLFKIAPS